MKGPLLAYLATGLTFLVMDAVWLTTMASRLYKPRIGALMADKPALVPAVAFYLIYLGGILVLAILPAARGRAGLASSTCARTSRRTRCGQTGGWCRSRSCRR